MDEPHPIVDLSLFKSRNFTVATVAVACFMRSDYTADAAAFLGVIDFFRASGWCLLALIPLIGLTKKSRGGH